jgi:hypothetical protein
MVEVLGKQLVYDAAKKVMDAPKTEHGVLVVTAPRPVKTGPGGSEVDDYTIPMPEGVIGVYGDPITAMEILATKDDDRRYLLYLLTDQNRPNPHVWDRATEWAFAETAYSRLVIAFDEKDVLQAAHLVRTAKKRMTSGGVMDQKAIGATRTEPFKAFEEILARKSPRGYVRSALSFSEKLDSTAAVDAAYKKFVSISDEAAVLEAARKMAADKPHLVYKDELRYLMEALNSPPTPEKPAETLVDYLKAVILAISKRDNAQTEQSLQSAEDALAVVESYLKQ